ncbi:MAG TPA: TIGR02270 family protein [Pirellulales bacterium]|nr:TIGR02270 family protein [Pirellulales bacterium]
MASTLAQIVDQHVEETAFLWLLRDAAVGAPHYTLDDLARLDERVEAHLDGLRETGGDGWTAIAAELQRHNEPGEVFAAAVLAFENGDPRRIAQMLEVGTTAPRLSRALISALGWLPAKTALSRLQPLLDSPNPAVCRVGIAAAAAHGQSAGSALDTALAHDDSRLRARALRAVGEVGSTKRMAALHANLSNPDPACRFWAAWSAALLAPADRDVTRALQATVLDVPPLRAPALDMLMRRVDVAAAGAWLANCATKPDVVRVAVSGFGALGDPAAVPRLIELMKHPPLARLAGEAFSTITGVHIAYDKLEGVKPEGFEAGPTENAADENVAPDPDEHLAWPDAEKVAAWWTKHQGKFAAGTRYPLGKPITKESLHDALRRGRQRHRAAAALELAIRDPGKPLFNVRARGAEQQRRLPM